MKKHNFIVRRFLVVFLLFTSYFAQAQNPSYSCMLRNFTQPTCNVIEFDVYFRNTNASVEFRYAMCQLAITMNPALRNGGVISVTPISGTSELTNTTQIPQPPKFTYDTALNVILVTAVIPPGTYNNPSIISPSGLGTRYIRMRLMNSVPWVGQPHNLAWNFNMTIGLATKMFAYVNNLNTDITVQASHTMHSTVTSATINTSLPAPSMQTLTGGGTFCGIPSATGAPVGLAGSQYGVAYQLWKDGVAVSPNGVIYGTGGPVSFGNRLPGLYQVSVIACLPNLFPTSVIVLPPNIPQSASLALTTNMLGGLNVIPASPTTVTFTAVPDAFSATTNVYYEWYVNNNFEDDASNVFTWPVSAGNIVEVRMHADPTVCVAPQISVANMTMKTCDIPTNLTTTSLTNTTATLAWTSTGFTYDIFLGAPGFTPNLSSPAYTAVGNPYTATGLTPLATYQYYVRSNCGGGNYSPLAGPYTFATCLAYNFPTNASICQGQSFTWRGNTYTTSGTYYNNYVTTNPPGCDSTYVLNLTVKPTYNFPLSVTICQGQSYTWRGNTYTAQGTYYDNLQTQLGCDSIYVLNLTVKPSYLFTTNASICNGQSYTWRGNIYTTQGTFYDHLYTSFNCDSIYKLNLTVKPSYYFTENASICQGETYVWHGNTYNAQGTYNQNNQTTLGCDSNYILNLTVNSLPNVSISGAPDTICFNYSPVTLTGVPSGGAFSGTGMSGSQFDPASAGLRLWNISYLYTDANQCSNTASVQIFVDPCTSVEEFTGGNYQIYPNPVNEQLTVRIYSEQTSDHSWQLFDMNGKLIQSGSQKLTAGENSMNIETAVLPIYAQI